MTEPTDNYTEILDQAIDLVLDPNSGDHSHTPSENMDRLLVGTDIAFLLRDLRTITEAAPPRAEFVAELEQQLIHPEHEKMNQAQQRDDVANLPLSEQGPLVARRSMKPPKLWQTSPVIGRLGVVAVIFLLVLVSTLVITSMPNRASAAEILKRTSNAGSFVPIGKVRHIVSTTTSDSAGGGSETGEVWLANGAEHLLMWKPAPSFSNQKLPPWGYSLLVTRTLWARIRWIGAW
jgi:hypothetical protein